MTLAVNKKRCILFLIHTIINRNLYKMKNLKEDIKKTKMENKMNKPPYATPGAADEVLDILRRTTPKKIDSKFVSDNNIATSSNAFRIVEFVKWFGIVDANGNVNENIVNKLKLVGEERNKFIEELIRNTYKELFDRINLEEARKDDIINFFISNYGFGHEKSKIASALFLHLCQKYKIPISDDLKKKTYKSASKIKNDLKKVIKKKDKTLENKKDQNNEGILIKCKISTILEPKTKEEADDIINNQLPSLFNSLKLFLPNKQEEEK